MARLAVRAARLFDGTGDGWVTDPLVLLEDGRITRVEAGAVAPPQDAELVELPGATLLPGLIDVHVHLGFDGGRNPIDSLCARDDDAALEAMAVAAAAQLAAGVTTVRDLGDRGYLAIRLRDEARSPLPTVLAAGPPITSIGGHCHVLGGVASGVAGVRAAVREHAERGVDLIKVMASGGMLTAGSTVERSQFSPAELRSIVDEAHRFGLPVTAHAHAACAVEDALAAGADGIEHCTFLTENGVEASEETLAALVKKQVAIGVTVGTKPVENAALPPLQVRQNMAAFLDLLGRMCAMGALVVAGTDAGIAPQKPHGALPYALPLLARVGLGNAAALRAATSVAAGVCGVGDEKGRLAPGFDADVLAVDGDPIADITRLQHPVAVWACGARVR